MVSLRVLSIRAMLEVHHRTYRQDHQEETQTVWEQRGQRRVVNAANQIGQERLAVNVVPGKAP